MQVDVHIRPATAEDMPILGRVLGANQAFFYLSKLERQGVILGAWSAGQPVAAICVSLEQADEPEVRFYLSKVPLLYRLHVHHDRRRQRIGTALLNAAEVWLKSHKHRQVAVGIDVNNSAALKFYASNGYEEWEHGQVKTVRELYTESGQLISHFDRCLIFVKQLLNR